MMTAVWTAGLVGCGALGGKPSARVVDAALVEQTDEGSRIEFVVELDNPRAENYPLASVWYAIDVEDAGTFRFTEYPIEALPGRGSSVGSADGEAMPGRQRLRLAGALPATGLAGRRWTVTGAVAYKPGGEIREILTDSGVPLPTAPFRGEGTLEAVNGER